MSYYFITALEKINTSNGFPHFGASRCWGFYTNFKTADEMVRNNVTDLYETVYDYMVIEEYSEGISGYEFERWFYKWDNQTEKYVPIEEPEGLQHYASFAIG